jgi:hypothetical protein
MKVQPKNPYADPSANHSPETHSENQIGGAPSSQQAETPENNTANPESTSNPEAEQNAYEQDQAITSPSAAEQHEQPANQVSFGEPSVSQESTGKKPVSRSGSGARELQELQSLFKEKRAVTDPAVLKLLDYIREMEDKNIQHMLDMMQQSLDRAHELMKKNEKIYYTETLPKLEGLQALVAQEQANEVAVQEQQQTQRSASLDQAQHRSDRTVAHKLQHLTREIQQTADVEVPPNHAQLLTELQQALQLALVL